MAQERTRRSERERQGRYRYESSYQERTMEAETKNAIVYGAALLNFRSEPDRTNPKNILDTLARNTKVVILDSYNDTPNGVPMAKVRLADGREGFVALEFLKEV